MVASLWRCLDPESDGLTPLQLLSAPFCSQHSRAQAGASRQQEPLCPHKDCVVFGLFLFFCDTEDHFPQCVVQNTGSLREHLAKGLGFR